MTDYMQSDIYKWINLYIRLERSKQEWKNHVAIVIKQNREQKVNIRS